MKKKMMMKKNRISPFYFDLNKSEINDLTKNFSKILKSSKLILGNETLKFESQFAKYIGTKYAIAVNSGTTALQILLMLNIKKIKTLVAVPTNTNFSTLSG